MTMHALFLDVSPFTDSVTPVSLGHVAAALRAKGHSVSIMSMGARTVVSVARLRSYLEEQRPRLVGFGAYQRNLPHIIGLARLVKQVLPASAIVLGGPQATFMPDTGLAALPDVDFLCRGEGEQVIGAIAEALEAGNRHQPVAGTTRRLEGGETVTGPAVAAAEDLDDYPSPWLSGVLSPTQTSEIIMLTSRGCTHNCMFCYTPAAFNRQYRSHSVERVLDEISYVASHGAKRLWFADPNFSFSEERVRALLTGILSRDLKVEMWLETRADMLSPNLIRLMKRAGVYLVAMGLESVSPRVVERLNKQLFPEQIGQAARRVLAAGLDVELFSQYALPNERKEDALATLQFVKDNGVKIQGNSNAQQTQLYFGSEISATPHRWGILPLRKRLLPFLSLGTEFETRWMSKADIAEVRQAWSAASLDGAKRVVS
jgi:radical SAM superfamily enzyme YgiQ (UPF0313 family)